MSTKWGFVELSKGCCAYTDCGEHYLTIDSEHVLVEVDDKTITIGISNELYEVLKNVKGDKQG